MKVPRNLWLTVLLLAVCVVGPVKAADDLLKQAGLEPPGKNTSDEPLAKEFSLAQAIRFLDVL